MDFDEAIAGLPPKYAEALRLRREGRTGVDIAARLEVPPESIDVLLQLAEAKLAALWSSSATQEDDGAPPATT